MKNKNFVMAMHDLKLNHDIDIIEDVLLRGDEYLLLYADVSDFEHMVLKVISGDMSMIGISVESPMISFSDLLAKVDYNNKYAEVSGPEEYLAFINREFRKLPKDIDLSFPITVGNEKVWIRVNAHSVSKNQQVCIFGISNVTELLNAEELIYEKTHKDALTGLFNQYSFDYHYGMRFKLPNTHIFYLDLDDFKQVNDTYGHAVGDRLLKAFSNLLKKHQKGINLFYRIGGDEFIGMFFEKEAEIRRIAESIIRETPKMIVPPITKPMTVSIGIIQSTIGEDLARKADIALYKVKSAGKNNYLYEVESIK